MIVVLLLSHVCFYFCFVSEPVANLVMM